MAFFRRRFRKSGFRKRNGSRSIRRSGSKAFNRGRFNRRSNKYRNTRVRIPNRIMPDYTLVRLKDSITYITPVGTTPTAVGELSTINFNIAGNDLFDAFDSLGTPYDDSQPTGFDQWMAFYNNFIVHKSSIAITPLFWNTTVFPAAGNPPYQITITPVTVSGLTSSNIDFDEQPYAKYRIYNQLLALRSSSGYALQQTGQQSPPKVFNSMMTKKMLGVKDLSDYSDVRGTSTTSPVDLWYWNVEIKSLVPAPTTTIASAIQQMGVRIDISYKVQLMDRNTIPESDEPAA